MSYAQTTTIRRALVSVTNKDDLVELRPLLGYTQGGVNYSWEFISTGGTAKELEKRGIPVTPIEKVTGLPEMMDGRLKTLHPKIFGGILMDRSKPTHAEAARVYGIEPIDLVVVNLYDFNGQPGIEQIDIGGPSLLRAAAKNCASVTVVAQTFMYKRVVAEILNGGDTTLELRKELARQVFSCTSEYDKQIADWVSHADEDDLVSVGSH